MARASYWFVLLCACHSTASVPVGEAVRETETEGSEVPTESVGGGPNDRLVEGTNELLVLSESFRAHEAYAESQEQRQAYGDGDECDGLCGLSTPSAPEPDPIDAEMELYVLNESLARMADTAETRAGEHWAALATRLRELAAGAQGEGDPLERLSEAVSGALAAIETALTSGTASAELCWLGTRLVASDVDSLYAAFDAKISELDLQMQIDAGMEDESGAQEAMDATEQELNELSAVAERAAPLIDRTSALLGEGPSQASTAVAELEPLASIIEPALGARLSANLRAAANQLSTVCAP